MRWPMLLIAFSLPIALGAKPPAKEQQTIAKRLGDNVQRFELWTDDDGASTTSTCYTNIRLSSGFRIRVFKWLFAIGVPTCNSCLVYSDVGRIRSCSTSMAHWLT